MKISKSHYSTMQDAISKIWTQEKHEAHRQFVVNENKAQDVEKRLRWDWLHYSGLTPFICQNIYDYADDTHIDTALRRIIGDLVSRTPDLPAESPAL